MPAPDRPAKGPLATRAPAKINLTLRILGRRADGYHALDSLVAFAGTGDGLALDPGPGLSLEVTGPTAPAAGGTDDNLVFRAARNLADLRPGLKLGRFRLVKRLPVAAGIGGGSSDAAAALRLLARLNGIAAGDPVLHAAARATGADVPVCLDPRARTMRGIGEVLGRRLALSPLFAVLVNPGIAVATADVFRKLGLEPGGELQAADVSAPPADAAGFLRWLAATGNDLESPARALAPAIDDALATLSAAKGCRLARMSGSGATCFGLFDDCTASAHAAKAIARARPGWWVKATLLR